MESFEGLMPEKIAKELRDQIIIHKKYLPGEKLPNERLLTQHFEVSRPVIREAMKLLSAQGIVEILHGSGTYVKDHPGLVDDPLGFQDISDRRQLLKSWYEARLGLETHVVTLIVKNASEEDLSHVYATMMEVEEAIERGDAEYLQKDREFHIELARITKNPVLEKLMIVLQQSYYYALISNDQVHWNLFAMRNAQHYHKEIMSALSDRDEVSAVLAMRGHMRQAIRDLDYVE